MAISLAAGAIIAAIISAVGAASAAGINYHNQQQTNQQNINAQNAINKQSQYNIEHAHQIEMADLQAAGLNPVLTATGGQGAPMASLNAPKAVAPEVDLSGVSSALQSMTHMMMMSQLVDAKVEAAEKSADAKIEAANITGRSRETVADKYIAAGRTRNLYKNESAGKALISNSKQIKKLKDDFEINENEWKKLMKKFENR
jgi:hypothetical protein